MKFESFINQIILNNKKRIQTFPSKEKCELFINHLKDLLFVLDIVNNPTAGELERSIELLEEDLKNLVLSIIKDEQKAIEHSTDFFAALPSIYHLSITDAEAILNSDPAARNLEEVMIAYPGFFATLVYRFSHQLFKQGLHTLARFFTEYAHSKTGIDIHPGASIGHSFAIDHGTGIVIGETSKIGNNVKIYQGVTLGALNVSKENATIKRHPTVEDSVVIYAGATILGGSTVIGEGCIIGGNVWITYSVPANSIAYHKSEIHIKDNNPFPEPINFII